MRSSTEAPARRASLATQARRAALLLALAGTACQGRLPLQQQQPAQQPLPAATCQQAEAVALLQMLRGGALYQALQGRGPAPSSGRETPASAAPTCCPAQPASSACVGAVPASVLSRKYMALRFDPMVMIVWPARWPLRQALMLAMAAAGVAPAANAIPDPARLCQRDEAVLFACSLGKRQVALCGQGRPLQRLAYRYGRPGRIELQHLAAPEAYFRSSAPLFGGGETTVGFARRGWEYRVYSRNTRSPGATPEERASVTEDGLRVARPGQPASPRVCSDGGAGFRADLSAIPRR